MTITRIHQCGFELNSLALEGYTLTGSNGAIAITTAKKTGDYGMSVTRATGTATPGALLGLTTATAQLRIGFYVYVQIDGIAGMGIISLRDVSNNVLISVRLLANQTAIQLWDSSQIGSNYPFTPNTWHHIGIDVKKDASAGWINLYVDGTLAASKSGNTSATTIANIVFGNLQTGSTACLFYYDDITIDNTSGEAAAAVVPDKRYVLLNPNGNGNYNAWVGNDGNSVDNYLLTDDIDTPHNSDTDYIYANSVDQLDSHTLTTYTLGLGESIAAVIPLAVVRKSDAGVATKVALGTRESATDSIGSDQDLPTSYGLKWERQTTKPSSGAWDQSSLDAVEVVVKSRGAYA